MNNQTPDARVQAGLCSEAGTAANIPALQPGATSAAVPAPPQDDLTNALSAVRCRRLQGRYFAGRWEVVLQCVTNQSQKFKHHSSTSPSLPEALGGAINKAIAFETKENP